MRPIIITSDKTSWCLRPMFYLLNKYWPDMPRALIGGYTQPDFAIDADWYTIGKFADYPVDRWSDGLIEFLWHIEDEIVLFLMDDYWLNAPVNHDKIITLSNYMLAHGQVARLDVTHDRLKDANWTEVGTLWGIDDLIISDPASPYHFSYQAALWHKSLLLKCLQSGETPWQSEVNGDARLRDYGFYVLGTRLYPMSYTIAMQHGKFTPDGGYQVPPSPLQDDDLRHILESGWVPDNVLRDSQHA